MAKVFGNNIVLNTEETALLTEGHEFELIPNQKGVFLLIEKEAIKENKETQQLKTKKPLSTDEEKQQVIGLIRKGRLSDLVEGKFESTLNEKQKKALLELVATQQVFVFKLNETYKKGVYRVKDDTKTEENREKKESEDFNAKEKSFEEYTLEKDGFLVIRSKEGASSASFEHEKQIREGHLKGIKSFDGNYYLIQTDLLDNYINKILLSMSQKNIQSIEELASTNKISKLLVRIICEFLKDEGELMEKKKETYQYIK